MKIKGIGASPGLALGYVEIFKKTDINIPDYIPEDNDAEIARFQSARQKSINEVIALYDKLMKENAVDAAEVFMAHKEILEDEAGFVEPVIERITVNSENAAMAAANVLNATADMFRSMDNEYMQARAADAEDLRDSVVSNILGLKRSGMRDPVKKPGMEKQIIAAYDLAPSDTAGLNFDAVEGIVTQTGGTTSHTAVMSRTLELPAVVGAGGLLGHVNDGDFIILDGETGEVIINPGKEQIEEYLKLRDEYIKRKDELRKYAGRQSVTLDGRQVRLEANIGTVSDAEAAAENGAEGIGLVRTEFLYMERKELPSEQEQYEAYKGILEKMGDKPVIFRTLDAGGDKSLPSLALPKEENPFLGYRAIRICLNNPPLFKTQLRALLRAGVHGNPKIMFPMISSLDELRRAKKLLEEAAGELSEEGVPYREKIPVGIMVEIPAVAVMADRIAKEVDFFSIGTNDLVQYTLAADRGNPSIADVYTTFHPAVLQLVALTISAAERADIPCGMCGEAAGNLTLVPLFLGFGLKEFSMSPSSVLKVRKLINSLNYKECKVLAEKVLQLDTADEIEKILLKV
ncbi:MAG: phosphoenolpyruvate--protein phosphotransferase [Eubacteriales bacterium]|nr:phosphoenolpyruvate--protein phosphotransferase [Eubacteriales bacterium]